MVRGRKAVFSDEDQREIVERYKNGAGIVELAHAYQCWTPKINEILKASGTPFRKMLTANTPIERRLQDSLMEAGIGFSTQRRVVGRYVVDILVNQAPVVIEADGVRHRIHAANLERDAIRDAAHEAAGYRVFRFTGSEINTDATACIQQVIHACGLVRDEEPVYDIRKAPREPRSAPKLLDLICELCGEKFSARWKRKFCTPEHAALRKSEIGIAQFRGKPKSAEHRARIGEANRRRVVTAETRAKMSASAMGKPGTLTGRSPSAETRAKISATLTGRRQSDETRAKKSAAHLGKPMPEGTGAKISAALKGKPKSPEHRANLSASRRRSNQIMRESDPA
jgi:very-short-patch-repair endonuclease/alpha-D-ribose 1-methylphosphonate 5-triphosphate synthase subunit PhnG